MKIEEQHTSPWKIRLFLLRYLPLAFLAGLRWHSMSDDHCEVHIRHRWINQNPFHSIYFAALLMAAELTTGMLVMREIQRSGRRMSMLVVHLESDFFRKARGRIIFRSEGGAICRAAVEKAIQSGEGVPFALSSIGYDEGGEIVAKVSFQWSVKVK